jgi:hypothetical protein
MIYNPFLHKHSFNLMIALYHNNSDKSLKKASFLNLNSDFSSKNER